MLVSDPAPNTGLKSRLLVLCILAIVTGVSLGGPANDQQKVEQMTADCRLEAEAAGLQGADLDQFIEQCVADLMSVEIHNLHED
jgi:hypothetical protein